MASSRTLSRPPRGIHDWMVFISLLASLPLLLLLAGVTLWHLHHLDLQRREALQRAALRTASLVQSSFDLKLVQLRTVGVGLAARQRLYEQLQGVLVAVAAADADVVSISLVDARGRRLVDSRVPWGQPLPPSGTPELDLQAIKAGAAVVSPLVVGSVSRQPVVGVAMVLPAAQDGEPALLRMAFRAEALTRLLQAQPLPPDWIVAVIDPRGQIAARNQQPERFVGITATDSVRAMAAAGQARVELGLSRDGQAVLTAVAPLGANGWFVAIGAPEAAIERAERQTLGVVLTIGAALAAASLAASVWMGRRVAASVRALAAGDSAQGQTGGLAIREVHHIRDRIGAHEAAAQGQAEALQEARHDALTGLPGRGLFLDQASQRLRQLGDDEEMGLLFIDLDGFKALNDRHGHAAGDLALQQVAQQLRPLLRPHDLAARLGGDEYVVALVALRSQAEAVCRRVAQRLLQAVPASAPGLGCSIGIAMAASGQSLADAMERADQAMLAAKRDGKGRVVLSESAAGPGASER